MKSPSSTGSKSPGSRRGVTLLLTLLVLVIAVTVMSRQMLRTTVDRLNTAAAPFAVESQWIADGVARQWLEKSQAPNQDVDELLRPARWTFEGSLASPRLEVTVQPSSAQAKLFLPSAGVETWTAFWRNQGTGVDLADSPGQRLFETGNTALEVILAPKYISAQTSYLPSHTGQIVLADVFTVWGDGRVDLNRAPLDILRLRLKNFTDAQLSGIVRLRTQAPITHTETLTQELSLSDDQAQSLATATATRPTCIELVIQVKKGGLRGVYHAVLTVGKNGQVQEVRPIL